MILLLALALLAAPPPSKPGAASPSAAPAPAKAAPAPAPAQPAPPSPEASPQEELRDFLAAQERWAKEAAEYSRDVQLLIERKFDDKRASLGQAAEAQVRELESDERVQRQAAIGRFETFLERYPREERFTPDAMFRLAELYFEETKDAARLAQREYEERLRLLPAGEDPPPEPRLRFDKPAALYRQLIARFPRYPLIDGVHYLLGYVVDQQGEPEEALQIFAGLIEQYPQSRFVPEAWMRIGEHHFDTSKEDATEELLDAAAAYAHVLEHPESPLYDKAVYKLGWTWYRLDRYDDAVLAFVRLIDHYQEQKTEGGELRAEALQYTAISFADEQWGGIDKTRAFFRKLGGRAWAHEVYRKLGDILFDQSRNAEAILAWRAVLEERATAPEAPQVQQRIVQAYERDRELEKAWRERDLLVKQFSAGSTWYEANKGDPEVLQKTRDLMERSLYSSAVFHHQQAQAFRKASRLDLALKEFTLAATAYGNYLARFPHAKNLYETRFFLGETQYNSLQFQLAADTYAQVRDDPADARYQTEAAYAAVLSLHHELERLQRAGKLQLPPLRKASERAAQKVEEQPVPEVVAQEIAATDTFLRLRPRDEKAPELAYRAAELLYRLDRFEEARKRFGLVLELWPGTEVAQYSANLILESWLAEGDWRKVEEFSAERLQQKGLDPKLRGELSGISVGARFKRATALLDAKQYVEASALFLKLVDDDPKVEFADKALNNAAFCYQQELRYDSALKVYERLFTQYPKSQLADTALFLVGFSAEKSFEFDKAIESYERLVDNYPQSTRRGDALFNEAHVLERLQRYAEANKAYARYAQLFPDKEDAPEMLLRGALVAERSKDLRHEIEDLNEFVRRFQRNEKQGERVVQAWLKLGLAWRALGDGGQARRAFAETCSEYDRLHFTPKDLLASASAAEARFNLAEVALLDYDHIRIEAHGRGKAFDQSLKAALTKKAEVRAQVLAQYKDVAVKYKRPDWIVAALYRVGYIDERFSAALTEAPVPPELKRLGDEYIAQYQDTLSQASIPIDARAMDAYKKAIETARELKIANEWTHRILESLDKYDHKAWPLLKEPRAQLLLETYSPAPAAP